MYVSFKYLLIKLRYFYFFIILLIGCYQEQYSVKINVVPENGGITNIKNNLFGEGEEVYFEAVPNQYYYFDFWSGDIKSNQSVISLNIYSFEIVDKINFHFQEPYHHRIIPNSHYIKHGLYLRLFF